MNIQLSRAILVAAMAGAALPALADDELYVFASKDGASFEGATIVLDGNNEKDVPASGIVKFDLDAGSHSIQILDGVTPVHSFRFDSAAGQLVDLGVVVEAGDAKHFVEAYSKIESASAKFDAPEGTVTGKVNLGGLGAAGATITIEETGDVFTTDFSGRFEITLPRGEYSFAVTHDDSSETQNRDVRFVSNTTRGTNFYLSSGESSAQPIFNPMANIPDSLVEEVFVTATFDPNAFGESEQFSSSVVNTLDFEEIARFGDSDVSAAIVRMPSVTVQDDSQVFIRGLGGRYVTTTLNGATLPSTNPNKRTIPLDLFPSNMVSQLDVKKTFTAVMPGESTGGNLVINTRSFPDERAGKLSVSLGGVTGLTGERVSSDPLHSQTDHFGYDDGSRKESGVLYATGVLYDNRDYFDSNQIGQIQRLGALEMIDGWDLATVRTDPNASIGLNFGDIVYLFNDYELGIFGAVNYKNSWSKQEEGEANSWNESSLGNGQVIQADDFTFSQVSNEIDVSGLLSLGLNLDSTTLESVTLLSRSTQGKVQELEGVGGDSLLEERHHSITWTERQFVSQQLSIEQLIGDSLIAEFQVTGSQANRYSPDRRDVKFIRFENDDSFSLDRPALTRRFDELVDTNFDSSLDFDYTLELDAISADVEFGVQTIARERDSDSRTYGFTQSQNSDADLAPNLLVSEVVNYESIVLGDPAPVLMINQTAASDSYDAEMEMDSAYVSIDTQPLESFQVVLGLRYEDFSQTIESFDLNSGELELNTLAESTVLPSLGATYFFNDSLQFRAAISETVSRPDFKEMSDATFYEDEFTNVIVSGNPNLQIATVKNYDVRAEYFGQNGDKVTVAAFYKDMENAIERVVQAASGTAANARTFRNSEAAEIYGIEFDSRLEFDLGSSLSRSMFVGLNASLIRSDVTESEGEESRALQGQPEYTFNLILGYDNFDVDSKFTLLLNQNGESIRDLGVGAAPDIYEEPRLDLNVNYSRQFTDALSLKAKVKNLLNSDVEYSQGGEIYRKYSKGVSYEVGVDWKF